MNTTTLNMTTLDGGVIIKKGTAPAPPSGGESGGASVEERIYISVEELDKADAMTRMTLKMFAESAKYDADGLRVTPLLLAAEMDANQGVEWIAYCINLSMEIVTPQLQGKIGELLAMQSIDVYQLPLMTKEQFYSLD